MSIVTEFIRSKVFAKLPGLPRRVKILRNLALLAAAVFLFYLFRGAPPFTDEELFRRKERQNLLGPSEVLSIIDWNDIYYDRLVVAQSSFGCVLMPVYSGRTTREGVCYKEKTGGVTLMVAPGDVFWQREGMSLWLIAFDDAPDAVRAEITLTLSYEEFAPNILETLSESRYEGDVILSSDRVHSGFFLFRFAFDNDNERDYLELQAIQNLARMGELQNLNQKYPASIRLYDEGGALIYEQETVLEH